MRLQAVATARRPTLGSKARAGKRATANSKRAHIIEVRHPKLTAFDERRDLFVIMRPRDRAPLQARHRIADTPLPRSTATNGTAMPFSAMNIRGANWAKQERDRACVCRT